ncbi:MULTISPECIES: DegT/DnrJ/EryC1/StrS family aminotransferase [Clostridium]|uniref:DegT/DnrJ/EryC1/StrS family aminotransferase n=1 Tax=Clostridium TaxID=1485 RepID=UPI0008254CBD|nr:MULTISPECIES: DegT/DnrJ/EryC1/StrS family aminotransferase [Clostridium]PJI10257.1 DegT/DnrJ/EryC1/StrS family aminotransferase [Clostridium sp. CT7]
MDIRSLKISFGKEERKSILNKIDECLSTGQISQGKNVEKFENEVAKYIGVKHAIAVNSGSGAIEVVMRVLGVKGKEVLIPTNTFMATATGVMFAGGKVKLLDADPKTFSVTLNEIKRKVTKNTAGVIIVHIGGIVTPEIIKIRNWCEKQGLWLYEDAAHAIGSSLNGKFAGTFGVAGSFSLFATKVITSGEGGVIVTNDDKIAEQIKLFRNHGKPKPWETYHTQLGSNYRMNELTSVIALSQFERLDEIINIRQKIADRYTEMIEKLIPEVTIVKPNDRCNWYKYIVLLPKGVNREIIKEKMKDRGISLQGEVYAIPLHKQPIAKELGFKGDFPNANDICSRHICLPIYPSLTNDEIEFIVNTLSIIIHEI